MEWIVLLGTCTHTEQVSMLLMNSGLWAVVSGGPGESGFRMGGRSSELKLEHQP